MRSSRCIPLWIRPTLVVGQQPKRKMWSVRHKDVFRTEIAPKVLEFLRLVSLIASFFSDVLMHKEISQSVREERRQREILNAKLSIENSINSLEWATGYSINRGYYEVLNNLSEHHSGRWIYSIASQLR